MLLITRLVPKLARTQLKVEAITVRLSCVDIANPKGNKKNAGFTMEERNSFTDLLKGGFVDSFRHKYPKAKDTYTFWSYMSNARKKNIGW